MGRIPIFATGKPRVGFGRMSSSCFPEVKQDDSCTHIDFQRQKDAEGPIPIPLSSAVPMAGRVGVGHSGARWGPDPPGQQPVPSPPPSDNKLRDFIVGEVQ